jgi:hypothetical protein
LPQSRNNSGSRVLTFSSDDARVGRVGTTLRIGSERRHHIVTLNEAEGLLGINRSTIKGMAWGLGIEVVTVGSSMVLSDAGFERLKEEVGKRPIPLRSKSTPAPKAGRRPAMAGVA